MQENKFSITKLTELVTCALKAENQFIANLETYYKTSHQISSDRFFLSLFGQSKEHLESLQELRQEGNMDELALKPQMIPEGHFFEAVSEDCMTPGAPLPDFLDFIIFCIKIKERTFKIYKYLADNLIHQDVACLFHRLADEEKKQKDMLIGRYELEVIYREQKNPP